MLYDAHGHTIDVLGTRTVFMSQEGQSVGAEFRVTNVRSPILSMEKLVKQSYRFEAGPTGSTRPQKNVEFCVGSD